MQSVHVPILSCAHVHSVLLATGLSLCCQARRPLAPVPGTSAGLRPCPPGRAALWASLRRPLAVSWASPAVRAPWPRFWPLACLVGPRPPACPGAAVRPPRNDSIPREEKQDVVQHTRCVTSKSRNAFVQGVFFCPRNAFVPLGTKRGCAKAFLDHQKHS